jgi:hypothetical protein
MTTARSSRAPASGDPSSESTYAAESDRWGYRRALWSDDIWRHIVGRNLELVPDRRIVQAGRVVPWPEGIFSIARFELVRRGPETRVIFDHTGFPSELAEHLESGWTENYWTALRKYLG